MTIGEVLFTAVALSVAVGVVGAEQQKADNQTEALLFGFALGLIWAMLLFVLLASVGDRLNLK